MATLMLRLSGKVFIGVVAKLRKILCTGVLVRHSRKLLLRCCEEFGVQALPSKKVLLQTSGFPLNPK